jgi:hypothetical protein
LVSLGKKLKKVNFSEILKARLNTESEKFMQTKFYEDNLVPIKNKIVESQARFEELTAQYKQASHDKLESLQAEMSQLSNEVKAQLQIWKQTMKMADSISK